MLVFSLEALLELITNVGVIFRFCKQKTVCRQHHFSDLYLNSSAVWVLWLRSTELSEGHDLSDSSFPADILASCDIAGSF